MSEEASDGVVFRKKSSWQKDDCLFCGDYSALEAVFGKSLIRCCLKEDCKLQAARLARETGK